MVRVDWGRGLNPLNYFQPLVRFTCLAPRRSIKSPSVSVSGHKYSFSQQKCIKSRVFSWGSKEIFFWEGAQPLSSPHPQWGGDTPPRTPPPAIRPPCSFRLILTLGYDTVSTAGERAGRSLDSTTEYRRNTWVRVSSSRTTKTLSSWYLHTSISRSFYCI